VSWLFRVSDSCASMEMMFYFLLIQVNTVSGNGRPDLEPWSRKARWNTGRKPRAGRQPEYRQAGPRVDKTPRVGRSGFVVSKAEGGGGASCRGAGREYPEEDESREGHGAADVLTVVRSHRTLRGEQRPEVGSRRLGAGNRRDAGRNGTRASVGDDSTRLRGEAQTPEGREP
jgi:hypothetical protein